MTCAECDRDRKTTHRMLYDRTTDILTTVDLCGPCERQLRKSHDVTITTTGSTDA